MFLESTCAPREFCVRRAAIFGPHVNDLFWLYRRVLLIRYIGKMFTSYYMLPIFWPPLNGQNLDKTWHSAPARSGTGVARVNCNAIWFGGCSLWQNRTRAHHVLAVPASLTGTAAERTVSKVSFPQSGRVGRPERPPPVRGADAAGFLFSINT